MSAAALFVHTLSHTHILQGRVRFSLNGRIVGSLVIEAVDALRREEEALLEHRRQILRELAAIATLRREVLLGRFAISPAVNVRVEAVWAAQTSLRGEAQRLLDRAQACRVELRPAVCVDCEGDAVEAEGAVGLRAQAREPAAGVDALMEPPALERALEAPLPLDETRLEESAGRVREALAASESPLLALLSAHQRAGLTDGYWRTLGPGEALRPFASGEAARPTTGGGSGGGGDEPSGGHAGPESREPASALYVLLEGEVVVRVEGAASVKEVATLDAHGASFGEMALMNGKGFKATVAAGPAGAAVFQLADEMARRELMEREDLAAAFRATVRERVQANVKAGESWRSMFLLHQPLLLDPPA